MKVLHIIFGNDSELRLGSLRNLMEMTEQRIIHKVLTDKADNFPPERGIPVTLTRWNSISICNKFLNILFSEMPNIVHVHGCWDHNEYQCLKMAKRRGFITFFTPYRELQPEAMKCGFLKEKLWKWLWFQRRMLQMADYVFAQDEKEMMELYRLKRMTKIMLVNAFASHTQETAAKIISTYAAACEEKDAQMPGISVLLVINKQLNALINGERPYYVTLPEQEQRQYDIFCRRQGLDKIITGYHLQKYAEEEVFTVLLKGMRDFRRNLNRHKATFADVFSIVSVMQNNDYDEDLLCVRMKKNNLLQLTRRLIAIANELCGVTLGYMPALPLEDKITAKMKLQILNRKHDE